MRFDYTKWHGPRPDDVAFVRQLMEIYRNLLLQSGGDVDEALRWMEHFGEQYGFFNDRFGIADFKKLLEQTGEVERTPQGFQITPKGERRIRQDSLNEIFSALQAGGQGDHRTPVAGRGGERLSETRPYQFGDNLSDLDPLASMSNALMNHGIDDLTLTEDDLEVFEQEHLSACATVLMVDISHSMILYGGVNKQIFMITDGKPSAIREMGRLYKNPFGLDPKIVNRTLEEASYCRKKRITITTFMLATDAPLLDFVRKLTDFVRNRRKRLH
jgi:uncharacterized protein with von Willebrand factor type A (vWA) domain